MFVHDRETGETKRVSVASDGNQATRGSTRSVISANGRFVAFLSEANNLVSGDTRVEDVFVHDLETGETTRVSVSSNGTPANTDTVFAPAPAISADGRFVAFTSYASTLVDNDRNDRNDVFVHDRNTGQTTRVSVASNGSEASADFQPSISGDGRFVAFTSESSDLVSGDMNNAADVFVHDRQTGTTTRVSIAVGGTEGDFASAYPTISGDGSTVAFSSRATNLISDDHNDESDIFVYNRITGETARVSVSNSGAESDGSSYRQPALSSDGRLVAFGSQAANLVGGDSNSQTDIFVRDREGEPGPTSTLTGIVTVGDGGTPLPNVTISVQTGHVAETNAAGQYTLSGLVPATYQLTPSLPGYFFTPASRTITVPPGATSQNFVAGLTYSITVVVRDAVNGAPYANVVITTDTGQTFYNSGSGEYRLEELPPGAYTITPALEGYTFMPATQTVTVPPDVVAQEFLGNNSTSSTTRVSVASAGTEGNGESTLPDVSDDGRYVVFQSRAANLVSNPDTHFERQIFVHDRTTGETEIVSLTTGGLLGNAYAISPTISADGRFISFESVASNLVADDENESADIFVHNQTTRKTTRVSMNSSGVEGDTGSHEPAISADGRFVAFHSAATNLVAGDLNATSDVFIHDRQTGETSRISVASNGAEANGGESGPPALSADGRFVAFASFAANLVPNDLNDTADIFVHDRETGETVRVSVAPDGTEANGESAQPEISAGGRFVVFRSHATNLVNVDTNGYDAIFLHDRETGATTLISVTSNGAVANDNSHLPVVSADGRFVTFFSTASNLANWQFGLSYPSIYLRDVFSGKTSLVSIAPDGSLPERGSSETPAMSADGRTIVYSSTAWNLVGGDENDLADILALDRTIEPALTSSISGRITDDFGVGLPNVTITTNSRDVAITDRDGRYSLRDLSPGSHVVTPTLNDYRFTPPTRTVMVPLAVINADFAATALTYSISGVITNSQTGLPLAGVTVGVNDQRFPATTTNEQGQYILNGLPRGHYELIPLLFPYTFSPALRVATVPPDATAQNFAATTITHSISGQVTNSSTGQPLTGVVITAKARFDEAVTAETGTDGRYTFTGLMPNTYQITATLDDYFFTPATHRITLPPNAVEQDFAAHPLTMIGTTTRVSVASDGSEANDWSFSSPALSADSRFVAFSSLATNLVAGDTNDQEDVFIHDRVTRETTRISIASDGGEGTDRSHLPSLSADGRYVAFGSRARNLVEEDQNGDSDAFVHDRFTGQTARVSIASNGEEGNGSTQWLSISPDGRWVAFSTYASNLVSGVTNWWDDIFIHDRLTGTTTLVSATYNREESNSNSYQPVMSADGRFIAFASVASNIVPNDENEADDIFLHDRNTGETILVSVSTNQSGPNAASYAPAISADGRIIAFASWSPDLVPGDTNEMSDIFVYDHSTGNITRVSVTSAGDEANALSDSLALSADGRFVAFASSASNLVSSDTNDSFDIFIHDRSTGETRRVSLAPGDTQADGHSQYPALSADGRLIAFISSADNLVSNDTNDAPDVFVYERYPASPQGLTIYMPLVAVPGNMPK